MSNLGGYITASKIMKHLGGPAKAAVIGVVSSYAVGRGLEAGVKRTVKATKAAVKKRTAACATEGQLFTVLTDGEPDKGPKLRAGDKYRVLDCDGDVVLIEVLGDPSNPYYVSGQFLATVSGFTAENPDQDK